ncbi:MAG: glycerophosphodiester phosphodiesterase family protein [Alphaproteobacteria bacterium]
MTLITAHRGGAGLWPENSLTAFRGAVGLRGLNAVELDVQACRDGRLVVFHDDTLERTSDGSGRLVELDFETVRRSRLTGTGGEPPPTLDEVLALLVPTRLELKLEIKVADGADADDMVARSVAATDAHGMTGRTLFMSFDRPAIAALGRLGRRLAYSVLTSWKADEAEARMAALVDEALAAHAAAIGVGSKPPDDAAGQLAARAALIARARAAGLRAAVWTVNAVDDLRAWLGNDAVDDVTTDWPDRALAIRDAAGASPWR